MKQKVERISAGGAANTGTLGDKCPDCGRPLDSQGRCTQYVDFEKVLADRGRAVRQG